MPVNNVPKIIYLDGYLETTDATISWVKKMQKRKVAFVRFSADEKTIEGVHQLSPKLKQYLIYHIATSIDNLQTLINSLNMLDIPEKSPYLINNKNYDVIIPSDINDENRFLHQQLKFAYLVQTYYHGSWEELIQLVKYYDENIPDNYPEKINSFLQQHDLLDLQPYPDLDLHLACGISSSPYTLREEPDLAVDLYLKTGSDVFNNLIAYKKNLLNVDNLSNDLAKKYQSFDLLLEAYLNEVAENGASIVRLEKLPKKKEYPSYRGKILVIGDKSYYIDINTKLHKGSNEFLAAKALGERPLHERVNQEYIELLSMLVDEKNPCLLIDNHIKNLYEIGKFLELACKEVTLLHLPHMDKSLHQLFITLLRFNRGPCARADLQERSAILPLNPQLEKDDKIVKDCINQLLMKMIGNGFDDDDVFAACNLIIAWEKHRIFLTETLQKRWGDDNGVLNQPLQLANEAMVFLIKQIEEKLSPNCLAETMPKRSITYKKFLGVKKTVFEFTDLKFGLYRNLYLYKKQCIDEGEKSDGILVKLIDKIMLTMFAEKTDFSFDPKTGKTYKSLELHLSENTKTAKIEKNLLAQGKLHAILKNSSLAQNVKEEKGQQFSCFPIYYHDNLPLQKELAPLYKEIYELAQKLWTSFSVSHQRERQMEVADFLIQLKRSLESCTNIEYASKVFLSLKSIMKGYIDSPLAISIHEHVGKIIVKFNEYSGGSDEIQSFTQLKRYNELTLEQRQFLEKAPTIFGGEFLFTHFSQQAPDTEKLYAMIKIILEKLTKKDNKGLPLIPSDAFSLKNVLLAGFKPFESLERTYQLDELTFDPIKFFSIQDEKKFNLSLELLNYIVHCPQQPRFKLFSSPSLDDQKNWAISIFKAIMEDEKIDIDDQFWRSPSSLRTLLLPHRNTMNDLLKQTDENNLV